MPSPEQIARSGLIYMPFFYGRDVELRSLQFTAPIIQCSRVIPVVELVSEPSKRCQELVEHFNMFDTPLGLVANRIAGKKPLCLQKISEWFPALMSPNSRLFPVFRRSMGTANSSTLPRKSAWVEDDSDGQSLSLGQQGESAIEYRIHELDMSEPLPQEGDSETSILLRDGFNRRPRNADYPLDEDYGSGPGRVNLSGYAGWGDYTLTGGQYSEGGGTPATVAIHLTYWAPGEGLRVRHYLSDTVDGTQDTAGKFGEALDKLILELNSATVPVLDTEAIRGFRDLHARQHFPGLPNLKLLSLRHHIETVCRVLTG